MTSYLLTLEDDGWYVTLGPAEDGDVHGPFETPEQALAYGKEQA